MSLFEDSIDPLITPPELLNPDTNDVVTAFKGVVPYSRYASDTFLSWRLRILNTKHWGAPVVTPSMISWIYTAFSTDLTAKKMKYSTPSSMGVSHSVPSTRKVKTPACRISSPLPEEPEETPSSHVTTFPEEE